MKKEKLSNKILKESENLSNKNGAWARPPKDQIKTILVENCQTCPFIQLFNEFGFWACGIAPPETFNLTSIDKLPENKVQDKCPLKNKNYRIRLK